MTSKTPARRSRFTKKKPAITNGSSSGWSSRSRPEPAVVQAQGRSAAGAAMMAAADEAAGVTAVSTAAVASAVAADRVAPVEKAASAVEAHGEGAASNAPYAPNAPMIASCNAGRIC